MEIPIAKISLATSIFFSISQTLIGLSNKKEDQSIGQSLLSMGKVRSVSGVSFTLVSADLSSPSIGQKLEGKGKS